MIFVKRNRHRAEHSSDKEREFRDGGDTCIFRHASQTLYLHIYIPTHMYNKLNESDCFFVKLNGAIACINSVLSMLNKSSKSIRCSGAVWSIKRGAKCELL